MTATSLQKKVISSIQLKTHMMPPAKFNLVSPIVYVAKKVTIFVIDSHMTSEIFCRSTYFITEMMQVAYGLLGKDLCNMSQQLFSVMWSHMTNKSNCRQTLLQMLRTCSGWKMSGTEVKTCFQNAQFKLKWLIFQVSNTLQPL